MKRLLLLLVLPTLTGFAQFMPNGDYFKPQLRFTQSKGWANDPNGLVFWKGEWHFFHQHNPGDIKWGPMHWNHAVSKDLLHWTELGDTLFPDSFGTMFSGSAVTDVNNSAGFGANALLLFYTAAGDQVSPKRPYTQCLAWSTDGRTFTKYDGNPILPCIAADGNRDPKVFWHAPSQRWVMALYGTRDDYHTFIILNSSDLKTWHEVSTYRGDHKSRGKWLYECPGLEELKIEGESETAWVVWGAGDAYAVGSFDGRTFTPFEERIPGLATAEGQMPFYAAQTYNDTPDGRKLWVAWNRLPVIPNATYRHSFSLTQELTLRRTPEGLRLVRRPLRELANFRRGTAQPLSAFKGELAEVRVHCRIASQGRLALDLRGIPLVYNAQTQSLTIGNTTARWKLVGDILDLTVFVDRVGYEVFSFDGLQMMPASSAIPDPACQTLAVKSTEDVSEANFSAWILDPQ